MTVYLYRSILLTLITIITLSSCNNDLKQEKVKEIDSLISVATGIGNTIDSIPLDSIDVFYSLILEQNKIFKIKMNGLPNNTEMRNKLFSYGNIEKGFKKLPPQLKNINSDLTVSIEQLRNLQHDITNDLIADSLYSVYYTEEKQILDRLSEETTQIARVLRKHVSDFHVLKQEIILYVDSLKNTDDKI